MKDTHRPQQIADEASGGPEITEINSCQKVVGKKWDVACAVTLSTLGQHASPKASSATPPTRLTAMPPPERSVPNSSRTTRPGSAIKPSPVAASIAEDTITNILAVMIASTNR